MITDWQVPTRSGPKPSTTPVNPHSQLDQTAPVELQDRLRDHALAPPGVGAAVGHVRQMVTERNFAPGNAGFIFYYDVLAPLLVIALYVAT